MTLELPKNPLALLKPSNMVRLGVSALAIFSAQGGVAQETPDTFSARPLAPGLPQGSNAGHSGLVKPTTHRKLQASGPSSSCPSADGRALCAAAAAYAKYYDCGTTQDFTHAISYTTKKVTNCTSSDGTTINGSEDFQKSIGTLATLGQSNGTATFSKGGVNKTCENTWFGLSSTNGTRLYEGGEFCGQDYQKVKQALPGSGNAACPDACGPY